jgi:hypothetical protein
MIMNRLLWAIALYCIATVSLAVAQEEEDLAAPPPIPPIDARPSEPIEEGDVPIPPKVQDDQIDEAVNIRRDEQDNIIEEYSRNGRVYMVRVVPKVGPPYYYLDDDGDGTLELSERDRAANPVKPVYWKLKEW